MIGYKVDKSSSLKGTIKITAPIAYNNNPIISKYFKNIGKNRAEIEKNSENYKLEYLLSLINSTLMRYFIKYNSKGAIDTYPDDWKKIPIKTISLSEQKPFIEKADLMLKLNKEFYDKKNKFFNRITKSFNLEKLNKKIDSFYELEFNDFVKEIEKLKEKLKQDKRRVEEKKIKAKDLIDELEGINIDILRKNLESDIMENINQEIKIIF